MKINKKPGLNSIDLTSNNLQNNQKKDNLNNMWIREVENNNMDKNTIFLIKYKIKERIIVFIKKSREKRSFYHWKKKV